MWLQFNNTWVNLDHLVRVEFSQSEEYSQFTATLTTVKPGGSDRTFLYGDDAVKLQNHLSKIEYKIIPSATFGLAEISSEEISDSVKFHTTIE